MKDNYIVLIVGKSGSGKSTICDRLTEQYGLKQVKSYTTRPRRGADDVGHTFITEHEFDKLQNMCAYTMFAGYKYCATQEQIDNADLYIIDPVGIKYFMKNYHGRKIPMVVYIDASTKMCRERMRKRGDSTYKIKERIDHDEIMFEGAEEYAIKTYSNYKPTDIDEITKDIYSSFFRERGE